MSKEAKDKAEELIEKFGIEKALLCVDEILNELFEVEFNYDLNFNDGLIQYWKQVKQEILNRQ